MQKYLYNLLLSAIYTKHVVGVVGKQALSKFKFIQRRENEIGETHPLTHLHNLYNLLFISIFACKLNPYLFDFIRMYMDL